MYNAILAVPYMYIVVPVYIVPNICISSKLIKNNIVVTCNISEILWLIKINTVGNTRYDMVVALQVSLRLPVC